MYIVFHYFYNLLINNLLYKTKVLSGIIWSCFGGGGRVDIFIHVQTSNTPKNIISVKCGVQVVKNS